MNSRALLLIAVGLLVLWIFMRKTVNAEVVNKISNAIARAEGFFVPNTRPSRNNNPGNLSANILGGPDGGKDGGLMIFLSPDQGWANLKEQVALMLNGGSRIYRADMTLLEVAQKYTATEQVIWATNVARSLGVPVTTRLSEIV